MAFFVAIFLLALFEDPLLAGQDLNFGDEVANVYQADESISSRLGDGNDQAPARKPNNRRSTYVFGDDGAVLDLPPPLSPNFN